MQQIRPMLAYHEVGHVVTAHALGTRLLFVTLTDSGGRTDYASLDGRSRLSQRSGLGRASDIRVTREALACMGLETDAAAGAVVFDGAIGDITSGDGPSLPG